MERLNCWRGRQILIMLLELVYLVNVYVVGSGVGGLLEGVSLWTVTWMHMNVAVIVMVLLVCVGRPENHNYREIVMDRANASWSFNCCFWISGVLVQFLLLAPLLIYLSFCIIPLFFMIMTGACLVSLRHNIQVVINEVETEVQTVYAGEETPTPMPIPHPFPEMDSNLSKLTI